MESRAVGGVKIAVVEFDYQAKEPDELSLIKGQIITNIKVQSGGWWQGSLASNGKIGMFPDNFVKLIDSQNDDKVILRDKSSTKNRRCKVIYSYKENKNDELSLAVGDVVEVFEEVEEGWWRGRLGSKTGVFPSNFVELIDSVSPVSANRKSVNNNNIILNKSDRSSLSNSREDLVSDDVPTLPPKPVRELCKVLFAYAPANEDELKLVEGDIITVLSRELPDKGWWKGQLQSGRVGVFPDNFVTLLPSDSEFTSPARDKPDRPPVGSKIITTSKSPNNAFRKDSFGSKDSLNESNLSTSLFGNVAAHRRSLENKTVELTEKPPRKSLNDSKTPIDIRKSMESLDEKKTTPPPVLGKKPAVPIKKSPSAATSAVGSLFSGLKQKVKGAQSHDAQDGVGSSRVSQVADNNDKEVTGIKLRKEDDFDQVERGSYLQDPRQNRAKAPKRRPPTSTSVTGDTNNNVLNGSGTHLDTSTESLKSDHSPSSTLQHSNNSEDELAKPKAREWEKHKAPWMAELKLSQMKKTSPSVEPRSPENVTDEKHDMSKSFSSSFVASKKASEFNSFEVRAHSVENKSASTFEVFKKEKEATPPIATPHTTQITSTAITSNIEVSSKSSTKISIEESTATVVPSVRPTSVSLRTRSISPIARSTKAVSSTPDIMNNHVPKPDNLARVGELENRVSKLEQVVQGQNNTIDELKKLLGAESDKVKALKIELEKYAQKYYVQV